jgi:hypothetical protein
MLNALTLFNERFEKEALLILEFHIHNFNMDAI